jgi:hypothetical protein
LDCTTVTCMSTHHAIGTLANEAPTRHLLRGKDGKVIGIQQVGSGM